MDETDYLVFIGNGEISKGIVYIFRRNYAASDPKQYWDVTLIRPNGNTETIPGWSDPREGLRNYSFRQVYPEVSTHKVVEASGSRRRKLIRST